MSVRAELATLQAETIALRNRSSEEATALRAELVAVQAQTALATERHEQAMSHVPGGHAESAGDRPNRRGGGAVYETVNRGGSGNDIHQTPATNGVLVDRGGSGARVIEQRGTGAYNRLGEA